MLKRIAFLALLGALVLSGEAHAAPVPPETVLKLLNQARAANHAGAVRLDRRLSRAALHHSHDMVRAHYFDHTSPTGEDLSDRVRRSGWARRHNDGWTVGENIGEASGPGVTADAIVAAWLASPEHRANLLDPAFRVVGIGSVDGTSTGADGLTITTDFGAMPPRAR